MNAYAHGLNFLSISSYIYLSFRTPLHGLWYMITWSNYLAKFPFVWWWSKCFLILSYLCYFITCGCWYNVVISFVNSCYDNDDLITFCKHIYFSFWFSLSRGMMLCWWCNLLFTFCYINGHLITLLQAAISYTHTLTSFVK